MLPLFFAAACVVAVCAESPTVGGYPSQGSSLRDYEYTSVGKPGERYPGAKPDYSEFGGSYIRLSSSPYSKSEGTLYTNAAGSNSESSGSGPRSTSLQAISASSDGGSGGSSGGGGEISSSASSASGESSFYKAKYANDATINAVIRPSYQNLPSGSLTASTVGGSSEEARVQLTHQTGYSSSGSDSGSSYYGPLYKERGNEQQLHGANVEPSVVQATGLHSEYGSSQARPAPLYNAGYSGEKFEYMQANKRPSSYSYGGLSAMHDYNPSGSRHYVHASYPVSDEATTYQGHATSHPYRSYTMSSPQSSYSSSKYQSVLGALKSLFGAGSTEPAASPSHPPSYLAPASSAHHGYYSAAMTPSMQASPSSHYFSSGPSTQGSMIYSTNAAPYSKNYPPMRLMSSYALNSASPGANSPGKIILFRDSSTVHGTAAAPHPGSSLGSPSSYAPAKSKISAFAPVVGASTSYFSAAPSSLSYTANNAAATYPSSASFPTAHGGSTFLGYSAN